MRIESVVEVGMLVVSHAPERDGPERHAHVRGHRLHVENGVTTGLTGELV